MKVAVVATLNDVYVPGFLVTLHSILKTTNKPTWDLVVFEWNELSDSNKELILSLYANTSFKKIDTESYKDNLGQDNNIRCWNYNCNYRFDIFTLASYDRVVYVDSDLLFELDIEELLSLNVEFAACQMPHYTAYNQIVNSKIFNAGLMIIGKKFLNEKTKQELIDASNTIPPFASEIPSNKWFGNQPILNNYFYEVVTWLPQKYNFLTEDLTIETFKTLNNYHFAGSKKPWSHLSDGEPFDQHVIHSINNKTDNIVMRKMILKKAREKAMNSIQQLLSEYPKIPFFDSVRKETSVD